MSRSKRFLGGVTFGYVNQALVMLVGLWLTPFVLNHIGQRNYGLWLVGMQALSYLMLMDFGVVAILPREAAYATGRAISGADGRDLPSVIGRTARVVLYQTPVVATAVAALWFLMPSSWSAFRGPIGVAMLGFTVLFPFRIFQAILHGIQDMLFLGRLQTVSWSLSTGLMILLVLKSFGLYALAIGWVAGQVISTAVCFYRLRTRFSSILPSHLPSMSARDILGSLTNGFWVTVSQVAQVLVGGTDLAVISRFLGPTTVVPYSCTQKLVMVLGNQPLILMESAGPGLSQMKTSESRQRLFQVSAALTQGMLTLSGGVACIALAVNHSFVSRWVGGNLYGGMPLTIAFVTCMLLRHWNTTTVFATFCFGHERRISLTTLTDGAISIITAVILLRFFGPIGAVIGSITGVCLVSLPGNLSALAREGGVSLFTVILSIWPWMWRFALLATVAGIVGQMWFHNTFWYIAGTAFCTGTVYCIVMLPMIIESQVRNYIPLRILQFLDGFRRLAPLVDAAR